MLNNTRNIPILTRLSRKIAQAILCAIAFLGCMFACPCQASLQASEHLGILSELTNPESKIAEQLVLTADQIGQLKQLTTRRTGEAVSLAAELKDKPKAEQSKTVAEFAAESERLAGEILDPEQKVRLGQLRLQWLGLVSLADEDVATALNLADWQRKLVADMREQVRAARRANDEETVKPVVERMIRQEISESQWTAWQVLAGLISHDPSHELPTPPGQANEPAPAKPGDGVEQPSASDTPAGDFVVDAGAMPVEEIQLELNFQRQPWGDVIKWLATEADLSVHTETTPPGSFTYRDRSRTYSVTETLDVMNAYLLDSGYSLFRHGRMLRCVNFEEDQKMRGEIIRDMTDTIAEEELATRGRYEPVRVMFNLKRLDPETILDEVEELLSIHGSVVSLATSGQLLVTDMAGNVRNVAEFIRRAEDPTSARGAVVQTLPLKSINAEEVLAVARPLLELETGSNIGENIKISTNTFGTTIYARGDSDTIQILRDLIDQMDRPLEETNRPVAFESPYIGRHKVHGVDLKLAHDIAQNLLSGQPDVKMDRDETAMQLVVLGRKADHEIVANMLKELAGEASDFKVIPLQNLDAPMAIAAVKKFFNLPDKPEAGSTAPVIDGDATARQVWVKGSETQVQQIEDLITKLEATAKSNRNQWGDHLRMVPLTGSSGADALRQAQELWEQVYGSQNPILIGNSASTTTGLKTKTFAPEKPNPPSRTDVQPKNGKAPSSTTDPATDSQSEGNKAATSEQPKKTGVGTVTTSVEKDQQSKIKHPKVSSPHFVSAQQDELADEEEEAAAPNGASPPIVIQEGPGGLMISSEDTEALDRFENLLRMVMDQSAFGEIEPIVVYLQNIPATTAKQLLTDILSGTASSSSAGGLLGDMASGMLGGFGGGMFGSLMGGGSSSTSTPSSSGLASGSYSIVADPRLNALFIKAGPGDMRLIEQLLRVIDQVEGPFSVETKGLTALIPVLTQDVNQMLATVQSVFGERIEGNTSNQQQRGPGGGQPNPGDFLQAMRSAFGGGRPGAGGQQNARAEIAEPKMSIGADTFTNTLVVVGQPYQIEQVRNLVGMLDKAGESEEEDFVAIPIDGEISSSVLAAGLKQALGDRVQTTTSGSSTGGSNRNSSTSQGGNAGGFDANAARNRAEFFQRMMQQGGQGGIGGTGGGRNRGGGQGAFGGGNFGGSNIGGGNFGGNRNSGNSGGRRGR